MYIMNKFAIIFFIYFSKKQLRSNDRRYYLKGQFEPNMEDTLNYLLEDSRIILKRGEMRRCDFNGIFIEQKINHLRIFLNRQYNYF